jgi:hypothetical protein
VEKQRLFIHCRLLVVQPLSSVTDGTSYGTGVVTLNATGSVTGYNWYAAATGGSPLNTCHLQVTGIHYHHYLLLSNPLCSGLIVYVNP